MPTYGEWPVEQRNLDVALKNDPESASRVRGLLTNAVAGMLRAGFNHSEAARIHCQMSAQKYRERWAQGDLHGLVPVLPDLVNWLRLAGIDPYGNADVAALLNDPYVQKVRSRITPVSYDRDFVTMFRQLATAIGR